MLDDITVKTRAAYIPTELQLAYNDLAIATKNADRRSVEAARKRIRKIEEASRSARFVLLEKVCEKQPGYKRKPWVLQRFFSG